VERNKGLSIFSFNVFEMKKFFYRLFLFASPLIVFMLVNMTINYCIYSHRAVNIAGTEVLILGDSHLMTAVDTRLFRNAKNICQSAEPPVVSYWKLKKILETNKPNQIVFGFAPHTISACNDFRLSDPKWSKELFRRIYSIQDFNAVKNHVLVDWISYYQALWKQTAFFPKKTHENYIGKFSAKTSSTISDWKHAIHSHYYSNEKVHPVSDLSIAYTDSIVELCKLKEVSIVFAGSPVHKRYYDEVPKSISVGYDRLTDLYEQQDVPVFNKTQDDSYADSLFFDVHHLNQAGAKRYTAELMEYLDKL